MQNTTAINATVSTKKSSEVFIDTTAEGKMSKKFILDSCVKVLNRHVKMDYDVLTLLEIFAFFDIEGSGDVLVEEYTGRVLYPVRIAVMKKLIATDEREIASLKDEQDHKALRIRAKALQCQIRHKTTKFISKVPASCVCDKPVKSKNFLVCDYCDTVVCTTCAGHLCAVVLKELIDSQEETPAISFRDEEMRSEDEWEDVYASDEEEKFIEDVDGVDENNNAVEIDV